MWIIVPRRALAPGYIWRKSRDWVPPPVALPRPCAAVAKTQAHPSPAAIKAAEKELALALDEQRRATSRVEELQRKVEEVRRDRAAPPAPPPAPAAETEAEAPSSMESRLPAGPATGFFAKRKRSARKMKRSSKMSSLASADRLEEQRAQLAASASERTADESSGSVQDGLSFLQNPANYELSREDAMDPYHVAGTQDDAGLLPKPIFVVSDCTGESACNTVKAALGQFEQLVATTVPANLVIFRFVDDRQKCFEIVRRAKREDALVVFTLSDPETAKSMLTACQLHQVPNVDLWTYLINAMEEHLEQVRIGKPLTEITRKKVLDKDYFKMIEAVEYTRKMDDGANPHQWKDCDLLILGVSRSGKTPLSIYLGQRGYKVANLPLVPDLPLPRQLYEVDPRKVVGLLIDPKTLMSIRKTRMATMGVGGEQTSYNDLRKIEREVEWAKQLYADNPGWLVMDVTLRGVEETSARILREMSVRLGDSHPMYKQNILS